MAVTLVNSGTHTLSAEIDDDGHFTATVAFLVKGEVTDGPMAILGCTGLPVYGDSYSFRSDSNPWAFCRPGAKVTIHNEKKGDPARYYLVEKTFSTKPLKKCGDQTWENPLLQPQKVSGTFRGFSMEETHDRYGRPLMNSAWERIRGKEVEHERMRPEVRIEQNVADLELPLLCRLNNTVNDATLWGFPRRTVRCVVTGFEQKYWGTCGIYYTRSFQFNPEVRRDPKTGGFYSGWDRDLIDEGTKALNGQWNTSTGVWELLQINGADPNPNNPAHFCRVKDRAGENTKVILDGAGVPINTNISGEISNITGALISPIVVTTTQTHGLVSGDIVGIYGFEGTNHAARGIFLVEVLSTTTFELYTVAPEGIDPNVDLSTAGNGTYESGGYWYNAGDTGPGRLRFEFHDEANPLLLGIPPDLNFVY